MNDILQHYPKDMHGEIKQIINQMQNVSYSDRVIELGFVDVFNFKILQELQNTFNDVELLVFDKSGSCERKYVILKPCSFDVSEPDLIYVNIEFNKKFSQITHSHILGTLINSDLDYQMIGDIHVNDLGEAQVIINEKIFYDLTYTCPIINNTKVNYQITKQILDNRDTTQIYQINCSSMRIDSIIKAYINKNRSFTQNLIKQKLVKKNQVIINSNTKTCDVYDIISIRGYGRFEIVDITLLRSSRYRVSIKY